METILQHVQGLVYSLLCLLSSAYQKASDNMSDMWTIVLRCLMQLGSTDTSGLS